MTTDSSQRPRPLISYSPTLRFPNPLADYDALLQKILDTGVPSPSRAILPSTGKPVDTLCLFGESIKIPLDLKADGEYIFPAPTRKKLFMKGVCVELLFFLAGGTDNNVLTDQGVHIWTKWAKANGQLGPIYGSQWRNWGGIDQLANVITGLKKDPHGRRHIVSAWNVDEIAEMVLPPCHVMFQFRLLAGKLHCVMTQRSADLFIGNPFNIASYAILTHMVARAVGVEVGTLTISFGDVHIYDNHREAAKEYLSRTVLPPPSLYLAAKTDIDSWKLEDIKLQNYVSHPAIQAEIAV